MEILKFILHILRSFGLLPAPGNDIEQHVILPTLESATTLGLPPFECPNFSPSGRREPLIPCNTPGNRSCWFRPNELYAPHGFDINTDYEFHWPDGSNREVKNTAQKHEVLA
jgi:hypothetical protein